MPSLTVIVPALARPQRVQPVHDSLLASLEHELALGWTAELVFVCSHNDGAEISAVRRLGLEPLLVGEPRDSNQYPRKINAAAASSESDWLLTGADDLDFRPGWLSEALRVHAATGALVIGTNDLHNDRVLAGRHATHSLVNARYLAEGTIDEPGLLLHPGYDHNACDVEFSETAMYRQQWAFARESVIEHLHPLWHREVRRDHVYRKGISNSVNDTRLLNLRRPLWRVRPNPPAAGRPRMTSSRRSVTATWPRR